MHFARVNSILISLRSNKNNMELESHKFMAQSRPKGSPDDSRYVLRHCIFSCLIDRFRWVEAVMRDGTKIDASSFPSPSTVSYFLLVAAMHLGCVTTT